MRFQKDLLSKFILIYNMRRNSHIAINIVAVVRPSRPNHVSENFGPMTWYIARGMAEKNYNGDSINFHDETTALSYLSDNQ